tara:strand:+ start:3011 stop:3439 length:429 start_codon:yes stop_codon:yes gene_type:complete
MQRISRFEDGSLAWRIYKYPVIRESTGELGILELGQQFDFDVKRVFFLRNIKDKASRGEHSHRELKQVLVCLSGSLEMHLDNGNGVDKIFLDETNSCLYLDGKVWRKMINFSHDALLLVLCDREYKFDDVIDNYEAFRKIVD